LKLSLIGIDGGTSSLVNCTAALPTERVPPTGGDDGDNDGDEDGGEVDDGGEEDEGDEGDEGEEGEDEEGEDEEGEDEEGEDEEDEGEEGEIVTTIIPRTATREAVAEPTPATAVVPVDDELKPRRQVSEESVVERDFANEVPRAAVRDAESASNGPRVQERDPVVLAVDTRQPHRYETGLSKREDWQESHRQIRDAGQCLRREA
jgi:hypothetical protein